MSDPIETTWIPEDELAKMLGVARGTVKTERPYAPSGGVRVNRNAIEWNEEAAQWLAITLKLPTLHFKKNGGEEAAAAAAPSADGIEDVAVISAPTANGRHFANPHLIRCRRASQEEVLVRVMDSGKYQPTLADKPTEPMTVRARKSPGGNWWELIGREPRWRGRW